MQLQKLAHHGLEHLVLHVDAADIAVGIRVAEAEHAHGLIAVEVLIALLDMDAQILTGVVIVHIDRDVKINAAHGVNELDEHLHVKERITVDPVAENLLRAADERLHAVPAVVFGRGIVLVHLLGLVGHVHGRIARDADKLQRLILRVEHTDKYGVRQAGRAVLAGDEERVAPFLAAVCADAHIVRIAVAQARRADPVVHQDRKLADEERQHHDHDDRDAHFFLFLALCLRLLRLHAVVHRRRCLGKRVVLKAAAVVVGIVIAAVVTVVTLIVISAVIARIAIVTLSSFHILFPCPDTSLMPAPCSRAA